MASLFNRFGSLFRAPPPAKPPAPPPAPSSRPSSLGGPVVSLWAQEAAPLPPVATNPALAAYYHLRTGRDTYLAADSSRIDMLPAAYRTHGLFAIIPDTNRQLCFLVAPDLHPIDVRSDGLLAIAISAFCLQTESGGVRLRHPLSPVRFMAATMPGQGAPDGCVTFDSLGRGKLDIFTPEQVKRVEVPECVQQLAAEICAAVARPYRAATLIGLLRNLAIRPALAEPLLRVLPRDELALLARDMLENPATRTLLAEVIPENPWFQRVIPELADWRATRRKVRDGVLYSPATDEFAGDPLEGYGQPQAGFVMNALARATIAPGRGACLIAAARNEGPYFLDWLAYHRALGFEHAFIYVNDNLDGSDALLERLAGHGVITLVQNQAGTHCGPQYKAHAHALSLLPQVLDYRWAALIDLDEYIGLDLTMFRGIDEFLAWHETQPVDVVCLCWLMFVAAKSDNWQDASTLARFTMREANPNQHVKSIFRPGKFWNAHAHYPYATLNAPVIFRTEDGGVHYHQGITDRIPAFASPPTAKSAWIAHYWLRSAPEALWKVARGHGDWKDRPAERHLEMGQFMFRSFVALAARTDLVEDRRMLAFAAAQDAQLAELRALPGVAEIDDSIRHDFGPRLAKMVRAFIDGAPKEGGEPQEFPPFREVLSKIQESGSFLKKKQKLFLRRVGCSCASHPNQPTNLQRASRAQAVDRTALLAGRNGLFIDVLAPRQA